LYRDLRGWALWTKHSWACSSPVETFRDILTRRVRLMLADEYQSSVICSFDDSRTRMFAAAKGNVQLCQRKKRKIRRVHDDGRCSGRRQTWCLGDNGDSSSLPMFDLIYKKLISGFRRDVYPIKYCDTSDLLLDRDINGCRNIGRIFHAYIESGGNINSRPATSSRVNNRRALNDEFDEGGEENDMDYVENQPQFNCFWRDRKLSLIKKSIGVIIRH
ncbi:hypothetical protein BDA99DRAFT_594929, partial [Phascolomyces articulosus]